jgi:hypothetical protein
MAQIKRITIILKRDFEEAFDKVKMKYKAGPDDEASLI